jgi:uncharacterized protein (DUF2252 family)
MLVSAFTFYREQRCRWPTWPLVSGLRVQLCGDAHLSVLARSRHRRQPGPRRQRLRRDPPGPFEWDVKRLAASLAGPGQRVPAKACRKIALAAAEGYRTAT